MINLTVIWHTSELCQAGIPFITALSTWGITPPTCTLTRRGYIFKGIAYTYSLHSKDMGRNNIPSVMHSGCKFPNTYGRGAQTCSQWCYVELRHLFCHLIMNNRTSILLSYLHLTTSLQILHTVLELTFTQTSILHFISAQVMWKAVLTI